MTTTAAAIEPGRPALRRALRLEHLSVGRNVVEGLIAIPPAWPRVPWR